MSAERPAPGPGSGGHVMARSSEPELPCPFCGSHEVELISPWGGQLITSQLRCLACGSYFEGLRDAQAWTSS